MKTSSLLKIINLILAIVFLLQAGSGIFHDFIPFEIFHKFHPLAGLLLVILVVIHIILNRAWIKNSFFKKQK